MRIENQRHLPGCSAGIAERTALVEIAHDEIGATLDPQAQARIRAGIATLYPEDPLFGVAEGDWPAAFLVTADRRRNGGPDPGEALGHWVVALTVAVQRWARDPVWHGRLVHSGNRRMLLAIPWRREQLFRDALDVAVRLITEWASPVPDQAVVQQLIHYLRNGLPSAQDAGLLPNTLRFIQAAVDRDIPFEVLPNCVQLGWGASSERIESSFTGRTGYIATMMAHNKFKASRTLADAGLPLPTGEVVLDVERAQQVAASLGWPVVVKPANSEQGVGVVPGICDPDTLRGAFDAALRLSSRGVIVERHVDGDDHRLLVVDGRLIASARRTPGGVTGDGVHTVGQLIERVNNDPRRGAGTRSLLRRLVLDDEARDCLRRYGLTVDSVPDPGQWIALRRTANISTGGTAVDITSAVHPDNRALAERAARIVGLDIAGIDFLCPDISRSWREVGGAICEVNAQPGFRPHWIADPGRDINGEILDILFAGRATRIPTAAITGTNGKTTTAMMLHHIWTAAGKLTGVCTTSMLRIGDEIVSTANLSGHPGARMILNDPGVQAGVFEMPRKGLIVFGHPCDRYDVAALLNVADDHIGQYGIDTLEQMAELKAEVLERATQAIVVNADDHLCLAMRSRAGTDRHILVARDPVNSAVVEHRARGGDAVFIDARAGMRWIVLATGADDRALMPVNEIPATLGGLLRFNETNAMFATALAWAQGVDTGVIRRALSTFTNSAEQNPGRYNVIEGLPFRVLLDYAHNPDGVGEICAVASALPVSGRRVICSLTVGNRHPSHVVAVAPVLAETFDEIVLGCDPHRIRGCAEYAGDDPTATMLSTTRQLLLDAGAAAERITTEADPATAIRRAMGLAAPGDLVVVLAEPGEALPVIVGFISG
jgi:cyanophycin synthetase